MEIPLTSYRRVKMNDKIDFLGQELEIATCPKCGDEFQVMTIDDETDICPSCSIEESKIFIE